MQYGYLFKAICIAALISTATETHAQGRGALWALAERICAIGTTSQNERNMLGSGISGPTIPAQIIQDDGPPLRKVHMPLAYCMDGKPIASGEIKLIFEREMPKEWYRFLTSPKGEFIFAQMAKVEGNKSTSMLIHVADPETDKQFETEKSFWLIKYGLLLK